MNILENVKSFLLGRRESLVSVKQSKQCDADNSAEQCSQLLLCMKALCNAVPSGSVHFDSRGNEICIRLTWDAAPGTHEAFSMNGTDDNVTIYRFAEEVEETSTEDATAPAVCAAPVEPAPMPVTMPASVPVQAAPTAEPVPAESRKGVKETMMSRLAGFLRTRYAFRYNILTEQAECARINEGSPLRVFLPAVPRLLNSISMDAMETGIKCWDKDVKRFVESDRIEAYHPFREYFGQLPEWDGTDRVTGLACRVSAEAVWVNGFHRWMLGMTAQWMGFGDGLRAQSVAPILVSTRQGWGKSTFCRMLVPAVLHRHFTESYDLSSPSSAEQKRASFGLINLDEFDKLPAKKLPLLKNLMQMESLNIRRAYRHCAEPLERLASFIGTSNSHDLLHDATGSRRFLCVELEHPIDCSPIDHSQLYAQLKHELEAGERYWFSKSEEAEIQAHNRPFYSTTPMEEVFHSCFEFAEQGDPDAQLLTAAEIYRAMKQSNPAAMRGTTCHALSHLLPTLGRRIHTKYCNGYLVKARGV